MSGSEVVLRVNNVSKCFNTNRFRFYEIKPYILNAVKLIREANNQNKNNKICALKNVSFEVKKGDFFGIIGKNGAGKSTLLKVISGIYIPDSGYVETKGKLTTIIELGIGFEPRLTALENVILNGVIMGMTLREIKQKINDIFDFAELKGFENLELGKYSSGMKSRLAFSVAAQVEGDIYLLDEVFATGDISFSRKALQKIEQLIKEGKTFVYVGHSMDIMRKYATNVLYLKEGEVQGIGLNMIDKYIQDQR